MDAHLQLTNSARHSTHSFQITLICMVRPGKEDMEPSQPDTKKKSTERPTLDVASDTQPKQLPKGVVLDKDGKPYEPFKDRLRIIC